MDSEITTVNPLLDVVDVSRAYGRVMAVDGVSLRLAPGDRLALVGANGAGKTTLLNLVAGLTAPDSGRVHFDGHDITKIGPVGRARLGVGRTHQRPAVWRSLTAIENVVVAAWRPAGGLLASTTRARYLRLALPSFELLRDVGLSKVAHTTAGALSHGQRRQLELAIALAGRPRLLLLDEPCAGLSERERHRLTELLVALPRTIAVLLVEHQRDLVEAVAESVVELAGGRIAEARRSR